MDNANSLALARIGIGAASWGAPELALRGFLLDLDDPQVPYLMRLFAAREIALGTITLMASPQLKPTLIGLGIAVDAADAGAGVLALRDGAVSKPVGIVLAGAAVAAVAAGVVAIVERKKG